MVRKITCPTCGQDTPVSDPKAPVECSTCGHVMTKWLRFNVLLDQWYEAKKWRKDIVRPDAMYVLEMLWTANGMGKQIYEATSPKDTPFSIFVYTVTRSIARGVDEGWVEIIEPAYPLANDPIYRLKFTDPDRLPDEIAKLYPDVNMDEEIVAPAGALEVAAAAAPAGGGSATATRTTPARTQRSPSSKKRS